MKALRQAFAEQVASVREEDLVFVDESGVNRAMTRSDARSLRGPRAAGSAPRNRGDHVSILGALTLRGSLEPMGSNGTTTGAVLLAFADSFLGPRLRPGAVVVMDNLSAHKAKAVRQRIEAAGARLLSLSPYRPDSNPVEMAWSQLKSHLRQVAARTSDLLDKAIAEGWRAVSADEARGCFGHCGYC